MTIRSMHESSLIHTNIDDREAILNYMAVVEFTEKILYVLNTIFKLEGLWIWPELKMSVCFTLKGILSLLNRCQNM